MKFQTSPLKPKKLIKPKNVSGIKLSSVATSIKYRNRDDLMLMSMSPKTKVFGFLTKSSTASPAVLWCKKVLKNKKARALIVNAGIANVFTGVKGEKSVEKIIEKTSQILGLNKDQVLIAQTGVIGEFLPEEKVLIHIEYLKNNLNSSKWIDAAKSIMTTDTFYKVASETCEIDGKKINITGLAKGSGMIAPNMATMLSFICTDANLSKSVMGKISKEIVDLSFNSITVDGDTSTSDTVLFFATGKAKNKIVLNHDSEKLFHFKNTLLDVCKNLSQQIVRDGEGASKFITINVSGMSTRQKSKKIALSIANSPLVKTAISANDANWGRIVMAIGKTFLNVKLSQIEIFFGDILIAKNGMIANDYDEKIISDYMKNEEIEINVSLGSKNTKATVWTCDLTSEYIKINGNYRS